jgi:hypothetical protein
MAEGTSFRRQNNNRTRPSEKRDSSDENGHSDGRTRLVMQRGISQLLFNYLPGRTVDWEDGLAIVQLQGVRLSVAWEEERSVAVLNEIAELFERWRARGGSIDSSFPDPRSERGRFTVGLPESVEATVLNTALICPRCFRLSFLKRSRLARMTRSEFRCASCGKSALRQIPHVFVHGCGELVPVSEWIPATRRNDDGSIERSNRPIRCPKCSGEGPLIMSLKSERVKDMKIVCQKCGTQIVDRLTARCHRCLDVALRTRNVPSTDNANGKADAASEDTLVSRIAMRLSRYSASATYYPQTLSMLRLDRPAVTVAADEEQALLRRMLPVSQRPDISNSSADSIGLLVQRLRTAEATKNNAEAERIRRLIAEAASASASAKSEETSEGPVQTSPDIPKAILESLAFRQSVSTRSVDTVIQDSGPGGNEMSRIRQTQSRLGIRELLIVDDLPVITATFGYTRRTFEPTYDELSAKALPTQIRAFPVLERAAAQRLGRLDVVGTFPILAREGEHEGLFLSLHPDRLLSWLQANGIDLPLSGHPAITRILHSLEPIDRYYDDIFTRRVRRMVFGVVHTLSHVVMRAISRFAGLERTSLSEYIFLPLLGAVVFDNSSTFRLGGIETVVRDLLYSFLTTLGSEATECLYDASCIDHRGACHGCIHSPEISCRVFNHGLSRAFLIGGHIPWRDVSAEDQLVGYWSIEDIKS